MGGKGDVVMKVAAPTVNLAKRLAKRDQMVVEMKKKAGQRGSQEEG